MGGRELRVAVVGAGIGGLTTGIACQRLGIEVEIFEQAAELTEVGAGLTLGANGSRLLERLGLQDVLRSTGVRPRRAEFRRWWNGEVFCHHSLRDSYVQRFGAPFYTVHRADVQQALSHHYDGQVRLAHRCVDVVERADAVDLVFQDGTSEEFDVVIGADGMHSVVRQRAGGEAGAAVFSGASGLRGLVPSDRVPPLADELALWMWLGPGQHFIAYPVRSGTLINFLAVVPDTTPAPESWSVRGSVQEAAAAYRGWDATVTNLIEAAETVGKWALYDREPMRRWSTRRVTVLGDAAHPMLPHHGQGANQSIEDAVVVADCLAGVDGTEVGAALHRYEMIRRPRARQLQLGSRQNTKCFQAADGAEARERDQRLFGLPDQLAWIHGYDAANAVRGTSSERADDVDVVS